MLKTNMTEKINLKSTKKKKRLFRIFFQKELHKKRLNLEKELCVS